MELLVLWFFAALEILAIYFLFKIAKKSPSKIKAYKDRPGPIGLIIQLSGISIPVMIFTAIIYVLFFA